MPESITTNSAAINTTGQKQASGDSSDLKTFTGPQVQENKTTTDTSLKTDDVNLKQLAEAPKPASTLTIQEARELKQKRSLKGLRNLSMTGITLFSAFFSMIAGLTKAALGEENLLSRAVDALTDKISSASFSIYGAFGSSDSIQRKDPGQLLAQGLEVAIPMLGDASEMTMNRRPSIGLANVFADAQKLGGGKKEYANFNEGLDVYKKAASKYWQAVRKNPMKAFFDSESGTAGITTGLLTSLSLIPYKLGFKKTGSILGQIFGILVEFASKLNPDNLSKGRYALFGSGALMTGSSALIMLKEFMPEKAHKTIENLAQAANILGKQGQVNAYNNGELALTEKTNHSLSEIPGKMLKAFLGTSTQAIEEPVIGSSHLEEAQAEKQAQAKSNSKSSYRSQRGFVTRTAPRVNKTAEPTQSPNTLQAQKGRSAYHGPMRPATKAPMTAVQPSPPTTYTGSNPRLTKLKVVKVHPRVGNGQQLKAG